MPLEYIMKLAILLIALVVIISIMYNYYMKAPTIGPNLQEEKKTQVIEMSSISTKEVAKFVEACWQFTYEKDEDFICFILKSGERFSFTAEELKSYLSADITSSLEVGTINSPTLIVSFDFANNKIRVYT